MWSRRLSSEPSLSKPSRALALSSTMSVSSARAALCTSMSSSTMSCVSCSAMFVLGSTAEWHGNIHARRASMPSRRTAAAECDSGARIGMKARPTAPGCDFAAIFNDATAHARTRCVGSTRSSAHRTAASSSSAFLDSLPRLNHGACAAALPTGASILP